MTSRAPSPTVARPLLPPPSNTSAVAAAPPPSATTATTTANPALLSGESAARVHTLITDDLRQLSRDDVDVKRWVNATLSRVLEAAKEAVSENATAAAPHDAVNNKPTSAATTGNAAVSRKPLQLEEQLVQLLQARVQTHSQELSGSIEDLISNTLVRLPRSTMELQRMSAETTELMTQLQRIEGVARPAAAVNSDSYLTELHMRKASEAKLRKCRRLLEKAARVEDSIRSIRYLVEQRESGGKSRSGAASPTEKEIQIIGNGTAAATATQQRDLDEVAGIIRQAREDLKEITAVDDTFGEQYTSQLEQFEQYIEQALEEECVACLRAHQLERAARLITTLHSIGRADAVLKRYGEQAASAMVEEQADKLRALTANGCGEEPGSSAAAAVAELLRSEIIPDDSAFLSRELLFLSDLVRRAAAAASATAGGGEDSEGRGRSRSGRYTDGDGSDGSAGAPRQHTNNSNSSSFAGGKTAGRGTAGTEATAVAVGGGPGSRTPEDDPRAAQILDVLTILLNQLHAPVHAALQPLLIDRPDTTNADFVACYAAIQQLKVSTAIGGGSTSALGATAAGAAAVAAKDPLEKLAREVTHRGLLLFARFFHEEEALQRYADRLCTPVKVYTAQPLSRLLAAASPSSLSAASALTSSATAAAAADASLAHVLIQSVREILLYVPDKLSARCIAAWHTDLSSKLTQQLQPTPSSSQHVLLQHLYVYRQRIKPLLAQTQQALEDWLSSTTVRDRYPAGSSLVRTDLQSRLWTPLKHETEEAQEAIEKGILHAITRPIVAKVERYPSLPCWGNDDPAAAAAAAGGSPTPAAAVKALGLYSRGQVAPSSAVRDMGEMLMELPLTLDTLGSAAVAETFQEETDTAAGVRHAVPLNDADAEEGVRQLIDEQAETWLETVVHDVVCIFLEEKVLPLQVGPFAAIPEADRARCYAMALEQLVTDLDYVRNILSAVNEETQEAVERVMSAVRALPAERQESFVVCTATHVRAVAAGVEEDEEVEAAKGAVDTSTKVEAV